MHLHICINMYKHDTTKDHYDIETYRNGKEPHPFGTHTLQMCCSLRFGLGQSAGHQGGGAQHGIQGATGAKRSWKINGTCTI